MLFAAPFVTVVTMVSLANKRSDFQSFYESSDLVGHVAARTAACRFPSAVATLHSMSEPRELGRPPAADTDARPVVLIGSALFFLGFLALLFCYGWLGEHHHRVWLWTCLAGWILGLVGWALMSKHRREGRTR